MCPKLVQHGLFHDCSHHFELFVLGGTIKPGEDEGDLFNGGSASYTSDSQNSKTVFNIFVAFSFFFIIILNSLKFFKVTKGTHANKKMALYRLLFARRTKKALIKGQRPCRSEKLVRIACHSF